MSSIETQISDLQNQMRDIGVQINSVAEGDRAQLIQQRATLAQRLTELAMAAIPAPTAEDAPPPPAPPIPTDVPLIHNIPPVFRRGAGRGPQNNAALNNQLAIDMNEMTRRAADFARRAATRLNNLGQNVPSPTIASHLLRAPTRIAPRIAARLPVITRRPVVVPPPTRATPAIVVRRALPAVPVRPPVDLPLHVAVRGPSTPITPIILVRNAPPVVPPLPVIAKEVPVRAPIAGPSVAVNIPTPTPIVPVPVPPPVIAKTAPTPPPARIVVPTPARRIAPAPKPQPQKPAAKPQPKKPEAHHHHKKH